MDPHKWEIHLWNLYRDNSCPQYNTSHDRPHYETKLSQHFAFKWNTKEVGFIPSNHILKGKYNQCHNALCSYWEHCLQISCLNYIKDQHFNKKKIGQHVPTTSHRHRSSTTTAD